MKVLVIKSAITGSNSQSNKKIDTLVEEYKKQGHEIVVRDIAQNPVPLFDANLMKGLYGDKNYENEVNAHNQLIEEVLSADEIVIGAPMYNFSIPVQLKAYLDAISRAGKTFKYTDTGPVGLLKAKKLVVVSSRGGYYNERGYDNMEVFLSNIFSFLGVKEHKFILIEGTAMGEGAVKEIVKE